MKYLNFQQKPDLAKTRSTDFVAKQLACKCQKTVNEMQMPVKQNKNQSTLGNGKPFVGNRG
ncbi:MAG: hypothetical protein IJF10_03075 [Clostridia bacterium]|nr:hypothetical protein [Clostridia bacterium]